MPEAGEQSWSGLPGAELVEAGIRDLGAGQRTSNALLVSMAASRLRAVGVPVPEVDGSEASRELYELLIRDYSDAAHSQYNALVRRIVSFARAAEHARTG